MKCDIFRYPPCSRSPLCQVDLPELFPSGVSISLATHTTTANCQKLHPSEGGTRKSVLVANCGAQEPWRSNQTTSSHRRIGSAGGDRRDNRANTTARLTGWADFILCTSDFEFISRSNHLAPGPSRRRGQPAP